MSGHVNPNLEHELRNSPALKIAMLNAATEAKHRAVDFARGVSKAPWMVKGRARPEWSQTIEVVQEDEGRTVMLVNKDSGGHLYEFGSVNSPAVAPLRRGVRAAGLRLVELPK